MRPELRAKIRRSLSVHALGESLGFVQNSAWIPGKKQRLTIRVYTISLKGVISTTFVLELTTLMN